MTFQVSKDAPAQPGLDRLDDIGCQLGGFEELGLSVGGRREDAVSDCRVEMGVLVQGRTRTVQKRRVIIRKGKSVDLVVKMK